MTRFIERVRRFVEKDKIRKLEKSTASLSEWILQQRDAHQYSEMTFLEWSATVGDIFEKYNYRGLSSPQEEQDLVTASTLTLGKRNFNRIL